MERAQHLLSYNSTESKGSGKISDLKNGTCTENLRIYLEVIEKITFLIIFLEVNCGVFEMFLPYLL